MKYTMYKIPWKKGKPHEDHDCEAKLDSKVRICQSKLELMSHSFQMQKDIGQIFDLISLAIINWVQNTLYSSDRD